MYSIIIPLEPILPISFIPDIRHPDSYSIIVLIRDGTCEQNDSFSLLLERSKLHTHFVTAGISPSREIYFLSLVAKKQSSLVKTVS